MEQLQIFTNEEFGEVRTIEVDGKPYFVGTDVAKALGYSKPQDAVSRHCRYSVKHGIPHPQSKDKSLEVNVIPEGDLYRLITHSELPSAQKFETWVFDEVIPSIRKHGMYATDELLNDPDLAIKVFTALREEREKSKFLSEQVTEQQKAIATMKPKADYLDMILSSKSLVTTTQIAKDYGYSAVAFNQLLRDLNVQWKVNKQWVLYAKYQGLGYASSHTINITRSNGSPDVVMQTEWTQKGRLFLYELLKKNGIYPTIEKPAEQYSFIGSDGECSK